MAERKRATPEYRAKETARRAKAEEAVRDPVEFERAWRREYDARQRANPSQAYKARRARKDDRRRLRVEATGVCVDAADIRSLIGVFGPACAYCALPFESRGRRAFSLDHVVPVAAGASLTWDNAVPCCRSCNASKSDGDADVWMQRRGFDRDRFYSLWERALKLLDDGRERPRQPPKVRVRKRVYTRLRQSETAHAA